MLTGQLAPVIQGAHKDARVFVGGAGLQPPETATMLKFRDGQRLVQYGPYADRSALRGARAIWFASRNCSA